VGKRAVTPYNGKEGPRSPHPPRGPSRCFRRGIGQVGPKCGTHDLQRYPRRWTSCRIQQGLSGQVLRRLPVSATQRGCSSHQLLNSAPLLLLFHPTLKHHRLLSVTTTVTRMVTSRELRAKTREREADRSALRLIDTLRAVCDHALLLRLPLHTSKNYDIIGESIRQAGKAVVPCSRG
jgi:hypothetical protein